MRFSFTRADYASSRLGPFRRRPATGRCGKRLFWVAFLFSLSTLFANQNLENSGAGRISIVALQEAVAEKGRAILSFRLEGVVCAAVLERKLMVLQDESGAALFEVPALPEQVRVGDLVAVVGENCALTRNRWRLQLGTAPVVDNDGSHPAVLKSGSVFLSAGRQPIQLDWFNSTAATALNVEYEGPGVSRQRIPDSVLWWKADGPDSAFQQGIQFAGFAGEGWIALPDFSRLKAAERGVAQNFDPSRRPQAESAALRFTGFIEIAQPGVHTFHLETDDGSRLYVGDPAAACKIVPLGRAGVVETKSVAEILAEASGSQWTALEGRVVFAGQNEQGLELELAVGFERVAAVILSGESLRAAALLQQRVRMRGVGETLFEVGRKAGVRLVVPGAEQVTILPPAEETGESATNALLTAASQVQRLKPESAREKLRVRIKGVVTQASPQTLVLQDPTGGVFVHYSAGDWTEQPRVGERWEIEGTTDPGDFSPVIRAAAGKFLGGDALPQPVRPTWEQLLNGSLDAQYVELQGVVTAVSNAGLTLLTPDGKLKVAVDELRWSYVDGRELFVARHDSAAFAERQRVYLDSVVRIRGCLVAVWNEQTRQAKAGEIRVVAAVVAIEEPRPADPFALAPRSTADLLRFDPRASALQRTKLAGQVIHARPPEYFLLDGRNGCRVLARAPAKLAVGDQIEAVGFPRLSDAAPALLEAEVRTTGAGVLPPAVRVDGAALLDREHDATLVQVEATLQRDSAQQDERVFELHAGQCHFIARLKSGGKPWKPLLPGSRLQLTGVRAGVTEERGGGTLAPFELLLNNPGAIVVLQQGPWWTLRHTITVVTILAVGLGLALVWIKLLRRQVEERTRQLEKEIAERQLAEHHRAMEQERTRVAQDLHDELGAGLTEVSILGSLARNPAIPAGQKDGYLDQLIEAARSLVTGLDEIVWAVNPHYDSTSSLASYYSLFAQRFLNLAGIACRLQVSKSLPDHPVDSRLRHGIFLAFKEALNNVVRHSQATEVQLAIAVTGNELKISVADNGRGFASVSDAPGSDGIISMKERMQKLGGDCRVSSEPGRGTTVEFTLPLGGRGS